MRCSDNCCKHVTVSIRQQKQNVSFVLQNINPKNIQMNVQKSDQCHHEIYDGPYHVVPLAEHEQSLQTGGKMMLHDVSVAKVPYYETSNLKGLTIYIASEV